MSAHVSKGWKLREPAAAPQQATSLFSAVDLTQDPARLYIGERANATGSHKFRDTLLANDHENAFHILTEQEETGAHVLDLSCGYAACPDLEGNKVVCDLLDTDRIGLNVTELFMCDPEVSTLALVTRHPQSYYFDL